MQILTLALHFLTGWLLCQWVVPVSQETISERWLKCFLAMALGLGSSSYVWMLGQSVAGQIPPLGLEALLIVALTVGLLRCRGKEGLFPPLQSELVSAGHVPRVLNIGFYILALTAIVLVMMVFDRYPGGSFDAWMIWNLHAKWLGSGIAYWNEAFLRASPWFFHYDYPLLLPSLVAQDWLLSKQMSWSVPRVIATLYTVLTIALVMNGLKVRRSYFQAVLAGTTLLGSTYFIHTGVTQIADVPLALYILVTFIMFERIETSGNINYAFLAGLSAGFASWTKNEGLIFVGALLVSGGIYALITRQWKMRHIALFLSGLLPILALTLWFKFIMLPYSDYVSVTYSQALKYGLDFERHLQILSYMLWHLLVPGIGLLSTFLVVMVGFLLGFKKNIPVTVSIALICMVLMLCSDYMAYLLSPHNLSWHLQFSYGRLLLQLWPSFVYVLCVCIQDYPPQTQLAAEQAEHVL